MHLIVRHTCKSFFKSLYKSLFLASGLVALWFPYGTAWAQLLPFRPNPSPFSVRHYTMEHGLPTDDLKSVVNGPNGYIWLGTGQGLIRYDGNEFYPMGQLHPALNQDVADLAVTSDSLLWMAFENGTLASLHLGQGVNTFNYAPHIAGTRSYLEAWDEYIMIATEQLIYMQWGGATSDSVMVFPSLYPDKPPYTLLQMESLSQWVLGARSGIYQSADQTVEKLNDQSISTSGKATNGRWIGSQGQVMWLDQDLKAQPVEWTLPSNRVRQLLEDRLGRLWVLLLQEGLYMVENNQAKPMSKVLGLNGKFITDMAEDAEGNLWLCTQGAGLYKIDAQPSYQIQAIDQLTNNFITSLCVGKDNHLWVGTAEGIYFMEDDSLHRIPLEVIPMDEMRVENIIFSQDTAWVGGALQISDWAEWEIVFMKFNEDFLMLSPFHVILPMDNDTLVLLYDLDNYRMVPISTINNAPATESLMFPNPNTLVNQGIYYPPLGWVVAGITGVHYRQEFSEAQPWQTLEGLPTGLEAQALYAQNGHLYIGTTQGLFSYHPQQGMQAIAFSKRPGSQPVTSLGGTGKDTLFVGTPEGLFVHTTKRTLFFDKRDGLPASSIQSLAYNKAQNTLFVGTGNGLARMPFPLPSEANFADRAPYITRVIQGDSVLLNPPATIGLEYPANANLTVHYSHLQFSQSYKLRYQYRYASLGQQWQDTPEPSFSLVELSPGTHTFEVRSSHGEEGQWSAPAAITFVVPAPWWQWVWLRLLGLGLLITLIILIAYQRVRRLRRRDHEAQELDKTMRQLRHQAVNAMMNPHFIFNALNSIQLYILSNEKEKANDYLVGFARLIRMNMDQSAETLISLGQELERLELYLGLERLRLNQSLDYSIAVAEPLNPAKLAVPSLLLQVFVENALWHGLKGISEPGKIEIRVSSEAQRMLIFIEDNGVGYRAGLAKRTAKHEPRGTRMARELVAIMEQQTGAPAHVSIDDHPERRGTRVALDVPIIQMG